MRSRLVREVLSSTAMAAGIMIFASPAFAQEVANESERLALLQDEQEDTDQPATGSIEAVGEADEEEEGVIITGSRIRRSATDTVAPVVAIDQQSMTDRGFVSASQALNQVTSNIPALALSPANGASSGPGQQFPNLFGLGPGRTLTLVNARRFVTTSSGLGDAQVDTNVIPTGLIERIEVVQAGGAVVYGSDAIAGVVNYILRDDFDGIELDGQAGISSRGDYPVYSLRGTIGRNFFDDRANIALNVEWSRNDPLEFSARPLSNLSRITQSNPADTGPNDGIPSVREIIDARFYSFNVNGVIFTIPAPVPLPPCGNQLCFARVGGVPLQFSGNGNVVPYNSGTFIGVPFAAGGEGFRFADLSNLRAGVERMSVNALGHFDITDNVKLIGEFLYARVEGMERLQINSRTILNTAASGAGPIVFTRTNPFLTQQAITTLSQASPAFAAGAPLFLSKVFPDLLQNNNQVTTTETWRGLLGLEGDFDLGDRDFYWAVTGSYARVDGRVRSWGVINSRFNNAISATRNASGQIVCAINADASTTNDDPACAPINPFGHGNVSQAARDYVNARLGQDFTNDQVDLLATLGGTVFALPGGDLGFSVAYEHRDEQAEFVPLPANQQGLTGTGSVTLPQSGGYNTDEFSAEVVVPILGGNFSLPVARSFEVTAAFRHVDNSIAGSEDLWSIGGRLEIIRDVALRSSFSRNFRAPTLTQLLAPNATALGAIAVDPCDADRITSGPNPTQRRASCLALFTANPGYGVLANGSNAGASAESRLATFQDPAENFPRALITTGGNPDLQNELSETFTYGIVIQPRFIPGLTIVADRIEVDLEDGLSAFTTQNFAEACYDNVDPPPGVCEAFTRLPQPNGVDPGGTIITGRTTTFNAGVVRFRGEVYNVNYNFPLASIFGGGDLGRLELALEATHTSLLTTSVTGTTFNRTDNTVAQPDWVARFDARYQNGPARFTYQIVYLDNVKANGTATIENNPNPRLDANWVHNASAQYDFGGLILRAGISNIFDTPPSYPNIAYGDILGRQFYVGARLRF